MRNVFINAGHFANDPGVVVGNAIERDIVMRVRDGVKALLASAYYLPDNLNLRDSIAWVNERAWPDDFAIDIHLNAHADTSVRGTEAYYTETPRYAEVFANKVSQHLQVPNRGPKHDSLTYVGSLGWLHQLKCPSVVVELCYLSNEADRAKILGTGGIEAAAQGIATAIETIFPKEDVIQKKISLLTRLIQLNQKLIQLLKGREENKSAKQ